VWGSLTTCHDGSCVRVIQMPMLLSLARRSCLQARKAAESRLARPSGQPGPASTAGSSSRSGTMSPPESRCHRHVRDMCAHNRAAGDLTVCSRVPHAVAETRRRLHVLCRTYTQSGFGCCMYHYWRT
jgi:hypothetical protein